MTIKFHYPHKTRSDYLGGLVRTLIKRRLELGMTQEELNYKLGVADRLVSKWEVGTRTPLTFHLYCWADALKSELTIIPFTDKIIPTEIKASNDNCCVKKNVANDNELVEPKKKITA